MSAVCCISACSELVLGCKLIGIKVANLSLQHSVMGELHDRFITIGNMAGP